MTPRFPHKPLPATRGVLIASLSAWGVMAILFAMFFWLMVPSWPQN